jgi:hypothetical protein
MLEKLRSPHPDALQINPGHTLGRVCGAVFPFVSAKKPRAHRPIEVKFKLQLPEVSDSPTSGMSKVTKSWIDDVFLRILTRELLK